MNGKLSNSRKTLEEEKNYKEGIAGWARSSDHKWDKLSKQL